jgi:hypothetical protein
VDPNRTLDYETPSTTKRPFYWGIFFPAWVLSLPVANGLDQVIHLDRTGLHSDSIPTVLSMFALVPALIIWRLVKRRWWLAAGIGGLCSPMTVVALYYLAWR